MNGYSVTRRRIALLCLLLVCPVVIIRLVTGVLPALATIRTSFTASNPMLNADGWVGLDNYASLFADPGVRASIAFTVAFTFSSTIIELMLGIAIAHLLNRSFRYRRVVRAANLLPWAIPAVVTGVAFKYGLDPRFGVLADTLGYLGFADTHWLTDGALPAQTAVIATNIWRNTGFVAIIMLAALQTIPREVAEAASVDGANSIQKFFKVTLPLVMPIVIACGIFLTIWQVASFDLVLAMTGGGPGYATNVLAYTSFTTAFLNFDYGRGSALAVMLFLFVALVGFVGARIRSRIEARQE